MGYVVCIAIFVLWFIFKKAYGELFAFGLCAILLIFVLYYINKYSDLESKNRNIEKELIASKNDLNTKRAKELDERYAQLNCKEATFEFNKKNTMQDLEKREKLLNNLKNIEIKKFPVIADIFADYHLAYEDYIENFLRNKPRPAKAAADNVKLLRQQKKELLSQLYAYKWELKYLHDLLPWIEDLEDSPLQEIKVSTKLPINEDAALKWLTPTEYCTLSNTEKYQLALDRYINKKKNRIEIGRAYERYIGYLYEMKGYKVKFFGIRKGLEDLGRDLICEKDGQIHIVQCKCWSKSKEIHENHINQLFGTTTSYYLSTLSNNSIHQKSNIKKFIDTISKEKIIPVFYSSTKYSDTAIKFAELLGVQLNIKELIPYPMIKCNINFSTKEHIYHLPFDQQYDYCMINLKKGEFYAKTVQEAEDKGFRRAQHWSGTFNK